MSGRRPVRHLATSALLCVATVAGPTACASDGDAAGPTTTSGSRTTFSAPPGIALDDTTADTTPGTTAPPTRLPDTVVLTSNGIGDHPLGTPRVDVTAMLTPLLGEPQVSQRECPGGSDTQMRYPGGLSVHFGGGQLSGWVLTSPPDAGGSATTSPPPPVIPIETDGGVTLGDTVGELQAAHPDGFQWIEGSSLGTEFYIGAGFPFLGGLASGRTAADTVHALWSGDTCAAR